MSWLAEISGEKKVQNDVGQEKKSSTGEKSSDLANLSSAEPSALNGIATKQSQLGLTTVPPVEVAQPGSSNVSDLKDNENKSHGTKGDGPRKPQRDGLDESKRKKSFTRLVHHVFRSDTRG